MSSGTARRHGHGAGRSDPRLCGDANEDRQDGQWHRLRQRRGMTLYAFDKDGKDKSSSTGGSPSHWPAPMPEWRRTAPSSFPAQALPCRRAPGVSSDMTSRRGRWCACRLQRCRLAPVALMLVRGCPVFAMHRGNLCHALFSLIVFVRNSSGVGSEKDGDRTDGSSYCARYDYI